VCTRAHIRARLTFFTVISVIIKKRRFSVDEIDRAQQREQADRDRAIAAAAKPIAPGAPGECDLCDLCGEWSGRLIAGACAPCRDRYHLP
jgi:hypothetical protein